MKTQLSFTQNSGQCHSKPTRLSIFLTIIFLGSVFLTSEKFNSTENSIKYYYTAIATLVGAFLFFLKRRKFDTILHNNYLSVQEGLFVVGFLQAIYGILQFFGACSSNHPFFKVTGSFENPAGYASVITLLYPIGLYWCFKSKGLERFSLICCSLLILIAIILSGSRTGLLAIIASTIILLLLETSIKNKLLKSKYFILIAISAFSILFLLYKSKIDSVDGRIFIWKVSAEMIKHKPLFGFGINGFQANYMNYQALYFEQTENSKYEYLADNVTNPFNEFVKTTVNFGLAGLSILIFLLYLILLKILKSKHTQRSVLLCIFVSLIVLCSFSYPLHYTPVWFLIGYFTFTLFIYHFPEKGISLLLRIPIISVCLLSISLITVKMCYELKWQDVSQKSLQGRTLEMLPDFAKLYPRMRNNELFLYNYGAELSYVGYYKESMGIMNECRKKYNDYDLQMILANNYYNLRDLSNALKTYEYAAKMIPCRFLPLYYQLEIYKEKGDKNNAIKIARIILNKRIKVKSRTVDRIIETAKDCVKENY